VRVVVGDVWHPEPRGRTRMTAEQKATDEPSDTGAGDRKGPRGKVEDGIKQGIGFLSAFRDALEETIQEARDRGDLSADRAKEAVKDALDKAQAASERARGKLDFATQVDVDALKSAMASLRQRVDELEKSVFGGGRPASGDSGGASGEGEEAADQG